jgi:hypothetical protein
MLTTASRVATFVTAFLFGATALAHAQAQPARPGTAAAPPVQLGALAPANLAKPRPKPPFDLTGTWQHDGRSSTWKFVPETFKLTPQAQVHYDAGVKALKDGGVYRDDIGQCWPSGMPLIMTRVWPIAMVQLPTAIYMISGFENSIRIIYLDGRKHTPADEVVRSFDGESLGRWEGDALVVDTQYFPGHHHWMDQGGASIPASEDLHITERFRMINNGTFEVDYASEVECLPNLNEHLPATTSKLSIK